MTAAAECATECSICAEHYFRPTAASWAIAECDDCPADSECPMNTTLATMQLHPGFWRLSNLTSKIYECKGGNQSCLGGATPADASCATGHAGPQCAICTEPRFYYDKGQCKRCPEEGGGIALLIGMIVLVAVLCIVTFWLHEQRGASKLACLSIRLRRLTHHVQAKLRSIGLVVKLKLAITFCQIIAALDTTYAIGLPDTWFEWTSWLRFFGELDWLGWVVPSEVRARDARARACAIGCRARA